MTNPTFRADIEDTSGGAVVVITGPFTEEGVVAFEAAMDRAVASTRGEVVVDLVASESLGHVAVEALRRRTGALRGQGRALTIRARARTVEQLLHLGFADLFGVRRTSIPLVAQYRR